MCVDEDSFTHQRITIARIKLVLLVFSNHVSYILPFLCWFSSDNHWVTSAWEVQLVHDSAAATIWYAEGQNRVERIWMRLTQHEIISIRSLWKPLQIVDHAASCFLRLKLTATKMCIEESPQSATSVSDSQMAYVPKNFAHTQDMIELPCFIPTWRTNLIPLREQAWRMRQTSVYARQGYKLTGSDTYFPTEQYEPTFKARCEEGLMWVWSKRKMLLWYWLREMATTLQRSLLMSKHVLAFETAAHRLSYHCGHHYTCHVLRCVRISRIVQYGSSWTTLTLLMRQWYSMLEHILSRDVSGLRSQPYLLLPRLCREKCSLCDFTVNDRLFEAGAVTESIFSWRGSTKLPKEHYLCHTIFHSTCMLFKR